MEIDVRRKVAIVTGGGRGIGREVATTLAAEGAIVSVLDIVPEYVDDVCATFSAGGLAGTHYVCDVRDSTRIAEVIADLERRHGRIDILVNNAGVLRGGWVEQTTEEEWDDTVDANLKGTFLMSRAVIPLMKRQRRGRIINAASFAAIVPSIGGAPYAAAKAGVVYFTRVLAGELGPWNVTVNCYAPGMIPTQLNHFADLPAQRQERLLDTLTIRRWGEKQDIARLVCFLSSDLAGYITGALIDISGGKLSTQIPRAAYDREAVEHER